MINGEINRLPVETLEKIFRLLDGKSLERCRRICKRWKAVIEGTENSRCGSVWQSCCSAEIQDEIVQELIGNKLISDLSIGFPKDGEFWRSVYIKWFRSKRIPSYKWLQLVLPLTRDSVKCLKISGNCIITGHASGVVHIYDVGTNKLARRVLKHHKAVTDIALVDLTNLGISSQDELMLAHHHVISASKDATIKIGCLLSGVSQNDSIPTKRFNTQVTHVRVFSKFLTVMCKSGVLHMWEMILDGVHLKLAKEFVLPGTGYVQCHWMGFFNDQIFCVNHLLDRYTFDAANSRWASCRALKIISDRDQLISNAVVVTHCFIFRQFITILLTVGKLYSLVYIIQENTTTFFKHLADRQLLIAADGHGFSSYSPLKHFKSHVTSIAVQGNLLAIATHIGSMYLYYFEDYQELLNLQLDSPVWKKNLGSCAITAIDISLDENQPILVASSPEFIYTISFFPSP